MKKVTRLSFIALASGLALSSCNDKNDSSFNGADNLPDQEILIPATAQAADFSTLRESTVPAVTEAEEFAKMLALSLKDSEMRKFLKSEANKKFDGDFDILVSNVVNANVGNGKFDEKVKKSSSKGYAAGNQAFSQAVKNPLLNIAVPMLIEKWNDTKQMPLVAVAVGAVEKETKQLKAFDSNGKTYLIDANIEPNVPVIVIANNERMKISQNKKTVSSTPNPSAGYALVVSATSARIKACSAPYRQNGLYEFNSRMWMRVKEYEGWFKGGPELRIKCFVHAGSDPNSYVNMIRDTGQFGITLNRDHIDGHWGDVSVSLFLWENSVRGQSFLYHILEEDGSGDTEEYSVSATYKIDDNNSYTGTTKSTKQKQDTVIGSYLVDQFACPPISNGDGDFYDMNQNFKFMLSR